MVIQPVNNEEQPTTRMDAEPTLSGVTSAMREKLFSQSTVSHVGRVVRAVGTSLRISGLPVRIGQRCQIVDRHSGHRIQADVVGLEQGDAILVPLGGLQGIATDSEVRLFSEQVTINVSDDLLGRVVDGFGQPLDGKRLPDAGVPMPLRAGTPNPLTRKRVNQSLTTGVKVLDALVTAGIGQRLGIFAPAGAGKSTLLGMLAGQTDCDVIVIGLIGERGREVREFLEDVLNEQTRFKSVVVVATSDRAAMERVSAAETATAIAEGFRDQGKHALLLIDSVTRYARAVREMGLAVGEPPVRQGFTPSVFAELPRLFERSGNSEDGCITAFYTVLSDDDTGLDPISEETRSILDGHIILSRALGERGYFPAVDVLASQSRLFTQLAAVDHQRAAQTIRSLLAKYRDVEFLIQVGEYKAGSDALADSAIALLPEIESLLTQSANDATTFEDTLAKLTAIANKVKSEGKSAAVDKAPNAAATSVQANENRTPERLDS